MITINRPEVLNALNHELVKKLTESIRELSAKKGIRILVLTGSGDRAFVGGADLDVFKNSDAEGAERYITDMHACFLAIRQSEKIVIASINGYTLGAGMEMAACCDLRIASERAHFGMPEVKVGVPSVIEAAYLPRLIGLGRAAYIIYTGEMIDAKEAERIGLINKVVPHEKLKEETWVIAEKILANGPTAILLQKKLIAQWMDLNLSEGVEAGIKVFRECFKSGEHREGVIAFLEKRKPYFGTKLGS
jgi:enoyl-CoA hydratase